MLSKKTVQEELEGYEISALNSAPAQVECDSTTHREEQSILEGQLLTAIVSEQSGKKLNIEKICCSSCEVQTVYESVDKNKNLYIIEARLNSNTELTNVYVWDVYKSQKNNQC